MNKNTKRIAEMAVLIAVAVVFEAISALIPFFHMPQGGAISLGMLPIFFIAFRYGLKEGLVAGFIFGIFNYLITPYFYHWAQVLIDYGVAFTVLGVAGIFKDGLTNNKHFVYGVLLAGFLRYLAHSFSGMIFFGQYAGPEGAFIYSFIFYNLPYMLISTLLCLIIGLMIKDRIFRNVSAA